MNLLEREGFLRLEHNDSTFVTKGQRKETRTNKSKDIVVLAILSTTLLNLDYLQT